MQVHDFRSDTVTLPTAAMMDAIAQAPLGDSARGDDPTVNALEALACGLTGKEDALFLPSGAMANLAAVMAHGCRGGEVIVEADAHIYNAEGGGLSVAAGAVARPVAGQRGVLSPRDVQAAIRDAGDLSRAPTRLVCVENTHNAAGGAAWPLESLAALHATTRAAGIPLHMDGARLFNAAAFLEVPIERLCRHADSLWFALCKGLGCPVGAVLAGDRDFMREARRAARMLGGGMRQAGLIAAPALVALHGDPYSLHRRDHALALRLAQGFTAIDPALVDLPGVQTNIVNCRVAHLGVDAASVARGLEAHGVRALGRGARLRFVTHAQVGDTGVDAAIAALAEVLRRIPQDTSQEKACST